jgi:hypothetical protein
MSGTARLSQRLVYWIAILTGIVFLYLGGGASLLPDRLLAPETVAWGTQLFESVGQYVWLPAVGTLLIVLGLFPAITRRVRGNRAMKFGVGLAGLGILGVGGMILGIPASTPEEIVYLSPLFISGILLVGLILPS